MMSVGIWILTSHICELCNRFFDHGYCSVMWRKCETKLIWNITYAYDNKINRCREFTFVKWTTFVFTLTCHFWFLRYRARLTNWLTDRQRVRHMHAHTHTHTHMVRNKWAFDISVAVGMHIVAFQVYKTGYSARLLWKIWRIILWPSLGLECNQDMVKMRGKVTWMVRQNHASPFVCQ